MEDIGNFDLPPVNLNGKKNFRGVKKYPRDFDRQGVIIVDYEYLPPKREVEKYEALVKAAEIRGERTDRIPLPKEKYLVPRLVSAKKYGFVQPSDEELAALEKDLGVKLLKPKQ